VTWGGAVGHLCQSQKKHVATLITKKDMAMRPKARWFLVLASLAGCAVGPNYRESVSTVPDRWQAGKEATGLKPIDPETLKNWWKSFGDARLDRLMDQALSGNLDLKIALARIEQATCPAPRHPGRAVS
jgi:hypothetical protein